MKKPKIGVIGVGRMGMYHANLLSSMDEADLYGICDINKERAKQLGDKFKVKTFSNYKDLLKKVDSVCISTPTETHYEIARDAILLNKNILVEKPVTVNLEHAKDLVNLSEKHNVIFHVGHVERFNAAVQQLKKIISHPYLIEMRRVSSFDKRVANVGVVLDLMIHDIDILTHLISDEIKHINSIGTSVMSKHEDIAQAQIYFSNGGLALLLANRVSQAKERTLSITQKDAFVLLDYSKQDVQIYRSAKSAYLLTQENIRYSQESFVEHLYIEKDNPLRLELQHFINCIDGKEKSVVSNEYNVKTLKVALQIRDQIGSLL